MQVLAVLVARDRIAYELGAAYSPTADELIRLAALDDRLKARAVRIESLVGAGRLAEWRETRQAPSSAWWWSLDERVASQEAKTHQVWDFFAGSFVLTISLSFTAEIARRFLSDGANFIGVFSTLSSVLLSVLGGTALTTTGSRATERLLHRLGVQRKHLHIGKAAIALGFLLAVVALRNSLPLFAVKFNEDGVRLADQQKPTSAIESLQRAINLNPDYAQAYYNLGTVYEDLLDFDKALVEYQTAMRLDPQSYAALNNLGRLYVAHKKDPSTGLNLLDQAVQIVELNPPEHPHPRYSIYKNRGWANFGLELFDQADEDLKRALTFEPNGAAANCLLAQVREAPKNPRKNEALALDSWRLCVTYAPMPDQRNDIEGTWLGTAKERIRQAEDADGKPTSRAGLAIGTGGM